MAGIKLSITPDCRLITYNLQGVTAEILEEMGGAGAVDTVNLEIYNNGSLIFTTQQQLFNLEENGVTTEQGFEGSINTYVLTVPSRIDDPGIVTFLMQDSAGNTASAAILVACELDCCLAQKVLDLTKCTDCNSKCSDKLAIAQKIFLYMESIRTMLAQLGDDVTINEGIISQALDTYNAAKELCSDSCGCNC